MSTTPAAATPTMELVERVAKKLELQPDELQLLAAAPGGHELIADAMDLLKLNTANKAAVLVALTRKVSAISTPEETLAGHFREEQKLRVEPWRAPLALVKNALALLAEAKVEDLQASFAEMGKHGAIAVDEAVLLQALLFFTKEQQTKLAGAILRYRGMCRLQIFNMLAAECPGDIPTERFVDERGAELLALPAPLWPRDKRFAALQAQQFLAASAATGGSAQHNAQMEGFRLGFGIAEREGGWGMGQQQKQAHGGGYAPVGQLASGAWAADTTEVESTLQASMRRQIQALEARLRAAGLPVKGDTMSVAQRGTERARGRGGSRGRGTGEGNQQATAAVPHQQSTPATTTRRARGGGLDDSGSGQQLSQQLPQQQPGTHSKDVTAAMAVLRSAGLAPAF